MLPNLSLLNDDLNKKRDNVFGPPDGASDNDKVTQKNEGLEQKKPMLNQPNVLLQQILNITDLANLLAQFKDDPNVLCVLNNVPPDYCNDEKFWEKECNKRKWDTPERVAFAKSKGKETWKAIFLLWWSRVHTNETLRTAVSEVLNNFRHFNTYNSKKYGSIEIWDTSKVTDMDLVCQCMELQRRHRWLEHQESHRNAIHV